MNTTYIPSDKIKQISNLCEDVFTPEIKSKIKRLSEKYKLSFGANKELNLKLFWNYCIDELSKDNLHTINTGQTLKQAIAINLKNGNATFMIVDYVNSHIEKNYKEDHKFLSEFDSTILLNSIIGTIKEYGLNVDFTANELFEVNNYTKFFNGKYGIDICDKKALQATEYIIKFIEGLTANVKNKENLMYAINTYIANSNKSMMHSILHN